jgi:hypothetical protein
MNEKKNEWHGERIECGHRLFEKECEMIYPYVRDGEPMPEDACQLCAQLSIAQGLEHLAAAINEANPVYMERRKKEHAEFMENFIPL